MLERNVKGHFERKKLKEKKVEGVREHLHGRGMR